MIKGIIFDCFGVLLADMMKVRIEAVRKTDPQAAQSLSDIMRASNMGLLGREEAAQHMADILHIDYKDILTTADKGETKNEQLVEFIKTLRPTYKVAMLSNVRSRERLEQRFDPGELDELFDDVIASGDVGIVKPERQVYELTAARIGVAPEDCVMIDDIQEFCTGAEAVGMRSIQFVHTDQMIADLRTLIDSEGEKY